MFDTFITELLKNKVMDFILMILVISNFLSATEGCRDFTLLSNSTVAGSIKHGYSLPNALITRKTEISFLCCVKACMAMKRCRSVNYFSLMTMCEVNHMTDKDTKETLLKQNQATYTPKAEWMSDVRCENNSTMGSVIDCGIPPPRQFADVVFSQGTGLYSKGIYKCKDGYVMRGIGVIGCQPNETWSEPRFHCLDPCSSCPHSYKCFVTDRCQMCIRYHKPLKQNKTRNHYEDICKSDGGKIVKINSADKQMIVEEFLKNTTTFQPYVWIQGERVNDIWRYDQDSNEMEYQNFYDGEGKNPGQKYLVIDMNAGFKWHDTFSGKHANVGVVCEFPLP